LDNAEALKWYLQAANRGDSLAQYNVGMRYLEGHGVKPDPVVAYKWLSLAAAQKLPDAGQALATLKDKMSSEDLAKARSLIRDFKVVGTTNR
jgi:TPR repeat protein